MCKYLSWLKTVAALLALISVVGVFSACQKTPEPKVEEQTTAVLTTGGVTAEENMEKQKNIERGLAKTAFENATVTLLSETIVPYSTAYIDVPKELQTDDKVATIGVFMFQFASENAYSNLYSYDFVTKSGKHFTQTVNNSTWKNEEGNCCLVILRAPGDINMSKCKVVFNTYMNEVSETKVIKKGTFEEFKGCFPDSKNSYGINIDRIVSLSGRHYFVADCVSSNFVEEDDGLSASYSLIFIPLEDGFEKSLSGDYITQGEVTSFSVSDYPGFSYRISLNDDDFAGVAEKYFSSQTTFTVTLHYSYDDVEKALTQEEVLNKFNEIRNKLAFTVDGATFGWRK